MRTLTCVVLLFTVFSLVSPAQQAPTTAVPNFINFSGTLHPTSESGVSTTTLGVTFAIYREQDGGAPVWLETQNVTPDSTGRYTVLLGNTRAEGIPAELFNTQEQRWLGVQVQGQAEQPRVLLVSVPYAMKARDAETVGGLPASAFALAGSPSASTPQVTNSISKSANTFPPSTVSGSGTKGDIPIWTSSTSLGNSAFFQTGTGTSAKVGLGTTTPAAPLDVKGIINSSTGFNLGGKPFAFGSFSNQDAFLGFAGNTTMTGTGNTASGAFALIGNTSGFNNTATGFTALQHNTTGCCNAAIGSAALQNDTTGYSNTATGYQALQSNSTGNNNTAIGNGALSANTTNSFTTAVGASALANSNAGSANPNDAFGYQALYSNTTGGENAAFGYQALYSNTTADGSANAAFGYAALTANTTGYANAAFGTRAMYSNTTANDNAAFGYAALTANTTGYSNAAFGESALYSNTTGFQNTGVGYFALGDNTTGDDLTCIGAACTATGHIFNATAIGAHAVVEQSNSLVLGGTGDYAVKVGIGTTTPSNVLTIARGLGHPVSDSWETYSSRRWKTNIQTLHGALTKVERLRGVSYGVKDTGKHEIGVIAEEVGQVVPEVVSYEANGKDARGVDYSRLTALLIEATKEQQGLIHKQQEQIRAQEAQINRLTSQVRAIQASIKTNGRTSAEVRSVKAKVSVARQ